MLPLHLFICPLVQGENPNPLVERFKSDSPLQYIQYTYNQPSGLFIFTVHYPNERINHTSVMADGKQNEKGRYGSMQDFAKSLNSLIQIIQKEHAHFDYLTVNLAGIDGVESRIREAALKSPEWKHRKPLKVPDVASYGDLVGEIILQKHVLIEIETVLHKYRLKMGNIGMENLGLTKSSDKGDYLPELLSCAEIHIDTLNE